MRVYLSVLAATLLVSISCAKTKLNGGTSTVTAPVKKTDNVAPKPVDEEDEKPENWAGDSYREYQKKRKEELGKDFKLSSGRGTGTKKWTDAPEKPSTKGYTVSTGRGTGKRKLE